MKTVGRVWTWGLREATHSEFRGTQHTSQPAHRQPPLEGSQRKNLDLLPSRSSNEEPQVMPHGHRHQAQGSTHAKSPSPLSFWCLVFNYSIGWAVIIWGGR